MSRYPGHSRSDRKRSYLSETRQSGYDRSRSPGERRQRSPERERRRRSPGRQRHRSPERHRRSSPEYERYNKRSRRPAWIDGDISEDDLREQAQGDPVEFRRLKRWKLNDRGVRGFWQNSPTPPPSPDRADRLNTQYNGHSMDHGEDMDAAQGLSAGESGGNAEKDVDEASATMGLQAEMMSGGPEAAQLHQKAAQLFKDWLTEEKAAQAEAEKRRKQEALDNVIVGPVPEFVEKAAADYGTHMRPGEGTAMAAYVQSGKRIPRRGEVGMSADEIVKYEDLGYVMSGSRHNRMNAIRIRKENQVYTAEEKAALAMFNAEENKRKEQKILADMQRLVQKTIGGLNDTDEAENDA